MSEWALRELPARVATFLHAVSVHAPIRNALGRGGYTPFDHEEGLSLLGAACAFRHDGVDPAEDAAARSASRELCEWSSVHVPRLSAALERQHPDAPNPFAGLVFSDPARVVLSLSTLLERLNALASTPHSRSPILKTLGQRAFGAAEREHLQALVRAAQRADTPAELREVGHPTHPSQGEASLLALYRWYSDWTTTARALIVRRDWLSKLGVRRRRGRGAEGAQG